MTDKVSCEKSDRDLKVAPGCLSHSDGDNRSNNSNVAMADINPTDGAVRSTRSEHEGSTIGQSAAVSVVTGKNVCRAAARLISMTMW